MDEEEAIREIEELRRLAELHIGQEGVFQLCADAVYGLSGPQRIRAERDALAEFVERETFA